MPLHTPFDRAPLAHTLRKVWRPAWFQNGRRGQGYFEGWYLKCVDAGGEHPVALIPGVALDPDGETSHAFVQLIRGDGSTAYWEYPASEFRYATDRFLIEVGGSTFGQDGASLALAGEAGAVTGRLSFGEWRPWPVRTFSPGIMGWYRFVPFMETYHGVLSLDHEVAGSLTIDGELLDFDGGRGYVEKDWGRSFPSAWIWGQSNHFTTPGTCVMVSVARIPWMRGSFVGYIVGLLHDDVLHEFTTYNGAQVTRYEQDDGRVAITLARRDVELDVVIEGAEPGELRSPLMGEMDGVTWESVSATAHVTLRRAGTARFEGVGRHAGAEFMDPEHDLAEVAGG